MAVLHCLVGSQAGMLPSATWVASPSLLAWQAAHALLVEAVTHDLARAAQAEPSPHRHSDSQPAAPVVARAPYGALR